jgi:holo-[acyl-carrier protein] synthase
VVLGIGIDVCDTSRIERMLAARTGARFRARIFTDAEQAYCEGRRRGRGESYAVRFAAKEAAMKALGTGWADGVAWREFEVVRRPNGAPTLALHGRAAAVARARGMTRWLVTLSHTGRTAIAWVLAEGDVRATGRSAPGRRRVGAAAPAPSRPRRRR